MAARRSRKHVRFTLDINFYSDIAKEAFADKLAAVRTLLMPRGAHKLDNRELLIALPPRIDSSMAATELMNTSRPLLHALF